MRAGIRQAQLTAIEAVLLALALVSFVLLRALLRRLLGRVDSARSQVRGRIEEFMGA